MNNNNNTLTDTIESNTRSYSNATSRTDASLPKWLGNDASTSVNINVNKTGSNDMKEFANTLERISNNVQVPEVLNYQSNQFSPIGKNKKKHQQVRKRESNQLQAFTSRLFAASTPNNVTLSSRTNYLIPKFNEYDARTMFDNKDDNYLERSWEGLSSFRRSHKGRLDSAKINNNNNTKPNKIINVDNIFTPLSSSSLCSDVDEDVIEHTTYSPSLLENGVPIRSKSEMSHRKIALNKEWHGGIVKNFNDIFDKMSISKSKSSENVYNNNNNNNADVEVNRLITIDNKDVKLTKSLNDYRLKVAREDYLRKEIIKELLIDMNLIRNPRENDRNDDELELERRMDDLNVKRQEIDDGTRDEINDEEFVIPVLPSGRILFLHIISTWGDKYYVGLNGIEIFADNGELVQIKKITASPPDVNVLPECRDDPRVVTNLFDGINRTQDDVHLWLAPFEKGKNHTITIEFRKITTIAMIRIWNYNKSRIHSYRGVKDLIMYLDDKAIFNGEIAKACGGILGRVDAFGDTILFTTDDSILELISHNDNSYLNLTASSQPETHLIHERPATSARTITDDRHHRPYTGVQSFTNLTVTKKKTKSNVTAIERIDLILLSNWGYANMIGLTSFELILENDKILDLLPSQITCSSYNDLIRSERLINGDNLTTNSDRMWCTSYDYTQEITITIRLASCTYVTGIRIWNYNENLETTYAGVSRMKILLDGKLLKSSLNVVDDDVYLLRRAPGNLNYDYVQDINFYIDRGTFQLYEERPSFLIEHTHKEEFYENSTTPEGFIIQFVIFSTWNDQYYCGLDGIELYDRLGRKIILDESNICAYPESINVLEGVSGDVRTPDKLIDGINNDTNGAHSWLAPIITKCLNRIYIVFDYPVSLSVVKLWNYSKTPNRGVKEFGILIDDLIVYNGILDKRNYKSVKNQYRTVVFTDDANVIEQELDTLIRQSNYGQDVVLLNDSFRSTTGGSLPEADPALRPFTSVSPLNLIQTSHSH